MEKATNVRKLAEDLVWDVINDKREYIESVMKKPLVDWLAPKIADAICADRKAILEEAANGGKCKDCGFEYREYNGHIIPCPRCRAEIAVEAIKKSDSALTVFRALQAPHDGIEKDGIEAAEIISETLKKLDL